MIVGNGWKSPRQRTYLLKDGTPQQNALFGSIRWNNMQYDASLECLRTTNTSSSYCVSTERAAAPAMAYRNYKKLCFDVELLAGSSGYGQFGLADNLDQFSQHTDPPSTTMHRTYGSRTVYRYDLTGLYDTGALLYVRAQFTSVRAYVYNIWFE